MIITKFFTYPIYPEAINIQWELDNTQLPGVYKFVINDSHTVYNKFNYILPFTILANSSRVKIKLQVHPPIIDPKRNINIVEKETYLDNDKNVLLSRELNRKENLRFSKQIGLQAKVLKRKTYGERCGICTDKLTGTVTNSQCQVCLGTGFIGGYYDPVNLWVELVQDPAKKEATDFGTLDEKTGTFRLTNEILTSKKDVICINNVAWELNAEPQLVMYRNFPLVQLVQGHQLAPKHVIYKLL